MKQKEQKSVSDPPQVIQMCTTCQLPFCQGECERVKQALLSNRKSWVREQEFLELYRQGLTDPKIAEAMGLGVSTIYYHRQRRGLQANRFAQAKKGSAVC